MSRNLAPEIAGLTARYASPASAAGVAVVPQFSSGSASSSHFDAAGRAAINLAGTTELRLRFAAHPASGSYLFLSASTPPVLRSPTTTMCC